MNPPVNPQMCIRKIGGGSSGVHSQEPRFSPSHIRRLCPQNSVARVLELASFRKAVGSGPAIAFR